jgi:Condensation domain
MSDLSKRIASLSEEKRRRLTDLLRRHTNAAPTPPIGRVERGDASFFPLSFAQLRLWFLDQLEPGSAAYNVPVHMRLRGPLDPSILGRSLDEVVRRHESLRTSFECVGGEPWQLVHEDAPVALRLEDLSALPGVEREAEVSRLAAEEVWKPFDLTAAPLVRARLLRLGPEEHVFLLTMHHIITDGWSVGVLLRELDALCDAFSRGFATPLPELPVQYADYAVWQREWLQGEELDRLFAHWREALAGAPPALDLPTDRTRSAFAQGTAGSRSILLTPETSDSLRHLSRSEGATLFTTLVAALDVLLYRCTGQEDLVVGTRAVGRNLVETEGIIGFFDNMFSLRSRVSGEMTFADLLRRVRENMLGAYAHQDLPFERLVAELQPERDLGRHPVFQSR